MNEVIDHVIENSLIDPLYERLYFCEPNDMLKEMQEGYFILAAEEGLDEEKKFRYIFRGTRTAEVRAKRLRKKATKPKSSKIKGIFNFLKEKLVSNRSNDKKDKTGYKKICWL